MAARLFDEPNLIDTLKQKYHNDPSNCFRELLQGFLTKHLCNNYTRDWKGIIELFDDLEEEVLAEEIKEAVLNKMVK